MAPEQILVLIPAYNEEERIGDVIRKTRRFTNQICVIDDGSGDQTGTIAHREGATVLGHQDNRGKGAAISSGFRYFLRGTWSIAITLDADGQHDPDCIPELLNVYHRKNLDLLLASRYSKLDRLSALRRITNRVGSFFISIAAGRAFLDTQTGYRVISEQLIRNLDLRGERFDYESEMIIEAARNGYRIGEHDVGMLRGEGTHTKWHPVLDSYRFIRLLLHYYTGKTAPP